MLRWLLYGQPPSIGWAICPADISARCRQPRCGIGGANDFSGRRSPLKGAVALQRVIHFVHCRVVDHPSFRAAITHECNRNGKMRRHERNWWCHQSDRRTTRLRPDPRLPRRRRSFPRPAPAHPPPGAAERGLRGNVGFGDGGAVMLVRKATLRKRGITSVCATRRTTSITCSRIC